MAKLIKANGEVTEVKPANEVDFTLEELQEFVGGYIEIVELKENEFMVLNEEGKLNDLPLNKKATELFREIYERSSDYIVGNVLIGDEVEIK